MTPRYTVHRKDRNHDAIVGAAEAYGAWFIKAPPLDGWVWCKRLNKYMPVEIKMPEREGRKHEYTPAQKRFFFQAARDGASWWVWRTVEDVTRDLGG